MRILRMVMIKLRKLIRDNDKFDYDDDNNDNND